LTCLEQTPKYQPKRAFESFILRRLELDLPFEIPSELRKGIEERKYLDYSTQFTQRLASCFKEDSGVGLDAMKLSAELLLIHEKNLLRFALEDYFDKRVKRMDAHQFSFRADTLYRCDQGTLRAYFGRLFWRYVEESDAYNFNLCSQFIGHKDIHLLEELFTLALSRAVQHSVARKDFEDPPPVALMLLESHKELLNSVIGKDLLARIRINALAPIPSWLLDLHRPNNSFVSDWVIELKESIEKNNLYSLLLAIELGMHYEELDLQALALWIVLPAIQAGHYTVIKLITLLPHIHRHFFNTLQLDETSREILNLSNMYKKLIFKGIGIDGSSHIQPKYCYVLTDQTIKDLQQFTREARLSITRKDWLKIYKLTYRVLLKETLLKHLPEGMDESIVNKLFELSQINYESYNLVVESMTDSDSSLVKFRSSLK
jgi:hypothetical protein